MLVILDIIINRNIPIYAYIYITILLILSFLNNKGLLPSNNFTNNALSISTVVSRIIIYIILFSLCINNLTIKCIVRFIIIMLVTLYFSNRINIKQAIIILISSFSSFFLEYIWIYIESINKTTNHFDRRIFTDSRVLDFNKRIPLIIDQPTINLVNASYNHVKDTYQPYMRDPYFFSRLNPSLAEMREAEQVNLVRDTLKSECESLLTKMTLHPEPNQDKITHFNSREIGIIKFIMEGVSVNENPTRAGVRFGALISKGPFVLTGPNDPATNSLVFQGSTRAGHNFALQFESTFRAKTAHVATTYNT